MTDQVVGISSTSFISKVSSKIEPKVGSHTWTLEQIRGMRQNFEKETSTMVKTIGDSEHQTMLVAMYEGTEKLLNRNVSDFAVMQYLEDLKVTAEDLSKRGMSGENYRTSLLLQSKNALDRMLSTG
jgi:hypothetical protein